MFCYKKILSDEIKTLNIIHFMNFLEKLQKKVLSKKPFFSWNKRNTHNKHVEPRCKKFNVIKLNIVCRMFIVIF